jgi:alkanesulfonate monooxygenase SsuD/methylene tetrahydromethanopterin reductase-like flavin-dependent oxidoreductase (luciferase family)
MGLSVSGKPIGANPVNFARVAEQLDFDFVSVNDHPFGSGPSNEPWTALTWIGASTTRIGLMTRVLALPFRHPALVAKMAATFDLLSGGRLILGLGAGAADKKMRSIGIDVPSPAEKITSLDEATTIARGLWSEPRFSFNGRRYGLDAVDVTRKPERPIPIWWGVMGPRGAELAGAKADGWIPHLRYTTLDRLRECCARVVSGAERAGRDPASLTRVLSMEAQVGELKDPPDNAVTGTPEAVAEQLSNLLDLGFDGINITILDANREEQAARLAQEVIPLIAPARSRLSSGLAGGTR